MWFSTQLNMVRSYRHKMKNKQEQPWNSFTKTFTWEWTGLLSVLFSLSRWGPHAVTQTNSPSCYKWGWSRLCVHSVSVSSGARTRMNRWCLKEEEGGQTEGGQEVRAGPAAVHTFTPDCERTHTHTHTHACTCQQPEGYAHVAVDYGLFRCW